QILVHITDTHVDPADKEGLERLRHFVSTCNTIIRPDVVVVTGDCTEHGQDSEFHLYNELFSGLDAKLLSLPGNHDKRPYSGFREIIGPTKWFYAARQCDLVGIPSPVDRDEFQDNPKWLEATLDRLCECDSADATRPTEGREPRPVLLFTHYPLRLTDERYLAWGKGHTTKIAFRHHMCFVGEQGYALLRLLMKYPVCASFHGHTDYNYEEQCIYSGTRVYLTADFSRSLRLIVIDRARVRVAEMRTGQMPAFVLLDPDPYIPGSENKISGLTDIRVMIFTESPVVSATWSLSGVIGGPLERIDENIWSAVWDSRQQKNGVKELTIAVDCGRDQRVSRTYKLIVANRW
ncbi:MAG: metallophosphoesterase family protein, partial [Limnochordia bacterium]